MTQVLLFSGSQRRESYNTRLLQHLEFSLQWQCGLDWLHPAEVRLPLFDQDLEADSALQESAAAVLERFAASDAIIIACPEYNGQCTPFLKNTIDWVTRLSHIDERYTNPFIDKPVLLCSASTGWSGGAVALSHLRVLFGYIGSNVLGSTITIANAHSKWVDGSFAFDDATEAHIEESLSRLLRACPHTQSVALPLP